MFDKILAILALLAVYYHLWEEGYDSRVRTPVALATLVLAWVVVGPDILSWIQGFELRPIRFGFEFGNTVETGESGDPEKVAKIIEDATFFAVLITVASVMIMFIFSEIRGVKRHR